MISKLKTLGLACTAVLAVSAVTASAAQAATEFEGGVATAFLTGEQIATVDHPDHTFTLPSGTVTCKTVAFTGTIALPSPTMTLTPRYEGCDGEGDPATVEVTGCQYLFRGDGSFDIVCEPSGHIVIKIFESAMKHTSNEPLCTYTIGAKNGLTGNTYSNTGAGATADVDITSTIQKVPVTKTQGPLLICGPNNQEGTYTGATTVRAYTSAAHTTQTSFKVN